MIVSVQVPNSRMPSDEDEAVPTPCTASQREAREEGRNVQSAVA